MTKISSLPQTAQPAASLPAVRGRFLPQVLTLLMLVLSLAATYGLWIREVQKGEDTVTANFEIAVQEMSDRIAQRMATYEQILRGTQGLYQASDEISREDFRLYVASLRLEEHYPGIMGIGLAVIIPAARAAEHVAAMHEQGFPDYAIYPPADNREVLAPIVQIEPFAGDNLRAHGFDMLSEPVRRRAMERARDTAETALSEKVTLVQEGGATARSGFIMFRPLYRRGMPTETIVQRRVAIWGWLEAPFRMDDLMAGVAGDRPQDLNVKIFDGNRVDPASLLYQTTSARAENAELQRAQPISIAGRTWTLQVSSLPAYEERIDSGNMPRYVAVTGISASLLLALLIWLLATARARAVAIATSMTNELRESEAWLSLALASAKLGVIDWDLKRDVAVRSLRHDQIYGHEQLLPTWNMEIFTRHLVPEQRDEVQQRLRQAWQEGQVDLDFRVLQPDGEQRCISMKGSVVQDPDGTPARLIGMVADITSFQRAAEAMQHAHDELEMRVEERTRDLQKINQSLTNEIAVRKRVEAQLWSSRERLASIFNAVTEGLVVQDATGRFIELNAAAEKIIGKSVHALDDVRTLDRIFDTIHEDGSPFPGSEHPQTVALRTGKPIRDVVIGLKKSETDVTWISVNTELLFDEQGKVAMAVSSLSDITDTKQSQELIWQQANYDPLTGLPNRRLFHDHLQQEIKQSRRSGLPLALLFLDLDNFKDVNDSLGHDVGDVLLKEASARIVACVRESDTVARIGGDEFTIILGRLRDPNHIVFVAQAILDAIAQPFHLGMETAHVSASIGITLYPDDATSVDTLVRNADQAMYAAKHSGRNRYKHFTESMQEATQARLWLANELRTALTRNQFTVVYQPIVELATGSIGKAEALIRWEHPVRGMISPAIFIPVAEETGMIVEIGDWIFREVAEQVKRWRAELHPSFQVSINRSPVQFRSYSEDTHSWAEYLRKLDLPGQSIALEITEGLLLDASSNVTDQLIEFRDAGIQVSLDDFGTGYSSLAYLKKFDIDHLKIDQSFVRNLAPDSDDMALCEAIIMMAHRLQIKVIAEGVETQQQRDLLAGVGCDYAQGYLFSRPVPAEEFFA